MKYAQLTKEQLEDLHPEFINFLAAQQIDKDEWDLIKKMKPEVANQEIEVFSDLIWESVLTNAKYLEHYSKNIIVLFFCDEVYLRSIIIKSLNNDIDLFEKEGLLWLGDNLFTDAVEVQTGQKLFAGDRNTDLFELIKQGAIFSKGELYTQIDAILEP